jgi:hypothetical protein
MTRILMIANDNERWGPARLPEPLSEVGLEVAAICSPQNPLRHSSHLVRHYPLEKLKTWRSFGKILATSLVDWQPDLLIPCDEITVVMLHYFLKRPQIARRYFTADQIALIAKSVGKQDTLDAMVWKHETRALAQSFRVQVPRAEIVKSAAEARDAASRFGDNVFVKASFSWGGLGTIPCNSPDQVETAYRQLASQPKMLKSIARRLLARDWYPEECVIEVQEAIAGESVMYSVAALEGKVLGGIFARRTARFGVTGPSTVVEISGNDTCRKAAEAMVSATGGSGFLAFDFIQCASTGSMFLLESNPRPNQICHLGSKVDQNLCQALANALRGCPVAMKETINHVSIPLFPQCWVEDESKALATANVLDVPANDAGLFDFMLRCGQEKGRSRATLLGALKAQGALPKNYTFG